MAHDSSGQRQVVAELHRHCRSELLEISLHSGKAGYGDHIGEHGAMGRDNDDSARARLGEDLRQAAHAIHSALGLRYVRPSHLGQYDGRVWG
jgi:peptidoglycan/xylan/chitin deacetylase (PgdA/CDA1 family)